MYVDVMDTTAHEPVVDALVVWVSIIVGAGIWQQEQPTDGWNE